MDLKLLLGFVFCVMVCGEQVGDDGQKDAGDDSDMYMEPLEEDHQPAPSQIQAKADSGHWYPTFARSFESFDHPPSGHSRPVFYNTYHQQEGAYSQRSDPPFQQEVAYNEPKYYNSYSKDHQPEAQSASDKPVSILGDGNFGVIQGGTFYPDKDGYESESSGFDDFSSYFHNGHGRPSYFYPSNPKPGKQQQFENFRDFAEINSPPERQYSQYVVVYTNKNGTRTLQAPQKEASTEQPQQVHIDVKRPKNILESLALLDHAAAPKQDNVMILTKTLLLPLYDQGDIIEIPPEKKLTSKSKAKLMKLKPEKKHEAKLLQKIDMKEPLLALS